MRPGTVLIPLIPLLSTLAACAATMPDPPPYPEIRVEGIERRAWSGARADYTVRAPLEDVRRVFLDRERSTDRERIVQITPLSVTDEDALVSVRILEPALGFEGDATCRIELDESEDEVRIRYQMLEGQISLWRLFGEVVLVRAKDGGGTSVRQEFLATVLSMQEGAFVRALRADAEAVRRQAEARRAEPARR